MEICNFLENLRYGRKLTQDEFVHGVVSLRQYQRYRSGESEITYDMLDKFAAKLGIPTKMLMYEFERSKSIQGAQINTYYNAVVNRDVNLAKEVRAKIEKDTIYDESRLMYFNHAVLLDNYYSGLLTKAQALQATTLAINFPTILKQEYFTDVEVLILSFLLSIYENEDQKKLLRKIAELFENEERIVSGENNAACSLILMRMAKLYGIQRDFGRVIEFCEMGIKRGIELRQYYLLEYFYYYESLAHFKLESYDLYEEALFRCYNILHFEGNKKKIDKFTLLIEKDFHINFDAFIINYLKKRIL
jgi:transcriptional regulator with XRE-family HTH domain